MKYKSLRKLMKKKNLSRPYTYANKALVFDGKCFKEMYKKSDCAFILGGEYDRYVSYLKNILSFYIKSNITCYVVFNGAMNADIIRRNEIHQKIINSVNAIQPSKIDNDYCEPIFVKDVYKDVLDELGIEYYVCMYDSKETLFNLARKLNCPILTNNFEYALFGVTVIPFNSVVFNRETQSITCSIYHETLCRRWNSFSNDIMSIVLTISDEDSTFYSELLRIFQCRPETYLTTMLYWIRRQSKQNAIMFLKSHLGEGNRKIFLDTIAELRNLFNAASHVPGVDSLIGCPRLKTDQEWYEHAVGTGRVAIQFINLKNLGILSGSWVVYDKNREDAMLPATDIALYVQSLLTNSPEVKTNFIGRKFITCEVKVIKKIINIKRELRGSKSKLRYVLESADHFKNFITEQLPGFNMETLKTVPKDCWMLLITLLYYSTKVKRDFTNVVYSFILSYVLLGPVSSKVGVIKRSNFTITHGEVREDCTEEEVETIPEEDKYNLTFEQCVQAAKAVIDLFYLPEHNLKKIFNHDTLHTFAEFQHCLQFMNYLNRLCGAEIKCTAYHKAINCTFIYNLYVALEEENSPEDYIENLLNCPPVYLYFKNILQTYFECLSLLTNAA